MRRFHHTKQAEHCPTVNCDKVWTLVSEATRTAKRAEGVVPVIDVTKAVSLDFVLYNFILSSSWL